MGKFAKLVKMPDTSSANRWSIVQVPRSVFAASISILSLLVVTFYYFGLKGNSLPSRCEISFPSPSTVAAHANPRVSVTWDMLVKGSIARSKEQTAYLDSAIHDERKKFSAMTLRNPSAVALISPTISCPFSLRKAISVRDMHEGGKWICGLEEVAARSTSKPCVVYSFGSNENDQFEQAVLETVPQCEIHVFDPTSKPLPQYHFALEGLTGSLTSSVIDIGGTSYPAKTLSAFMEERKHVYIDILKIDVEGFEWAAIGAIDFERLCIGTILLEIHDFNNQISLPCLRKWIDALMDHGFHLFSLEPVCAGCADEKGQYEIGFLNVKWDPAGGCM